jgi:predicted pyridoxine 5'-phosphate oxidase superfamily flavin-nucleotide-binding protein
MTLHKTLLVLLVLFTTKSLAGTPNFKPSKSACAGIDKQIERVNDRLRAGYKVREGERLKDDLRTLKSKRYSCTSKGYSVK